MSTISNNRYSHFHNPLYKQHNNNNNIIIISTFINSARVTQCHIVQVTEAIDKIYLKTGVLQYVTHNDVHGYNNHKNNLHI